MHHSKSVSIESLPPQHPAPSVKPARREFGLATRFFTLDRLASMPPVESQQKIRARARFQKKSRSTSSSPEIEPHLGIARGRRIRAGPLLFRGMSLGTHASDRIPAGKPSAQASAEPARLTCLDSHPHPHPGDSNAGFGPGRECRELQ